MANTDKNDADLFLLIAHEMDLLAAKHDGRTTRSTVYRDCRDLVLATAGLSLDDLKRASQHSDKE